MLYPVELRAPRTGIVHQPPPRRRSGRGRGIRTPDILLPKQARYQTALYPGVRRPQGPTGTRSGPDGRHVITAWPATQARKFSGSRLCTAVAAMAAWPMATLIWLSAFTTS